VGGERKKLGAPPEEKSANNPQKDMVSIIAKGPGRVQGELVVCKPPGRKEYRIEEKG